MAEEQKLEFSPEQLTILLQIVNKTSVLGEQVEIVANLKQTLVMILKQKQRQA